MSSFGHDDNKKKYILIFGEGSTQGLDDTALTAEKKHSIDFTESRKKFCLSLHYNGANSHLFGNGVEIIKYKVKDSEIVATLLCLGSISKDISVDNMKKSRLNRYVCDFNVGYDAAAANDILGIHKHLMKKLASIFDKNQLKPY